MAKLRRPNQIREEAVATGRYDLTDRFWFASNLTVDQAYEYLKGLGADLSPIKAAGEHCREFGLYLDGEHAQCMYIPHWCHQLQRGATHIKLFLGVAASEQERTDLLDVMLETLLEGLMRPEPKEKDDGDIHFKAGD